MSMIRKTITITATSILLTGVASAGNSSSNSSSNSSNGVHTRHDTLVTERDGRRYVRERYERRYDRPRREDRRRWREDSTADRRSDCLGFLAPAFRRGVVIPTRSTRLGPAIADVVGRIDYVFPGGSTLGDRGVYTPDGLRAEYLRSVDAATFERELNDGYVKGVVEQAPSVIALNARASSAPVMEYIVRAFPFRHEPNSSFARSTFSLAAGEEEYIAESEFTHTRSETLSRGGDEPLVGLPYLTKCVRSA